MFILNNLIIAEDIRILDVCIFSIDQILLILNSRL